MLGRLALRIATIAALMGRTSVNDNVLDSEIGALDIGAGGVLRTAEDKPFISIYVEGGIVETALDQRALHKSGQVDLLIEIGITAAMTETDEETGESKIIGMGIPATDAAMELFLDTVGREIGIALSDPHNAWAKLWRELHTKIVKIERRRTSDATTGTRIAAHQIVITVELLPDPVYGEAVQAGSAWAKLLARLEAEDHPFLSLIVSLIGSPAGVRDHDSQRRRFGTTLEEARALMSMAIQPGESGEPLIASVSSDQVQ